MKTAFLLMRYFLDEQNQIHNDKFNAQIAALGRMGYEVEYLGFANDGVYLIQGNEKTKLQDVSWGNIPVISKIAAYVAIYQAAITLTKLRQQWDFTYIRAMFPTLSYVKAIQAIKAKCPHVVMEIPTYPPDKEMGTDKRFWRKPMYAVMRYLERAAAQFIDLYALIGEHSDVYLNRPAITIENGVEVDTLPARSNQFENKDIHILALAKMARWHGYDRLITGLRQYIDNGGETKVYIHLVGNDGDGSLAEWYELARKLDLLEYILFEGSQYGKELDAIVNRCDIACDSLGAYRKNMTVSSSLKMREYFARGIPCVYTCEDRAVNEYQNYLLKVPDNGSPIDIKVLVEFALKMKNDPNITNCMRAYAKEKMTWETQFLKILGWFEHGRKL